MRVTVNAHSHGVSVLLTALLFVFLSLMLVGANRQNPPMMAASAVYAVFLTVLAYLIFRTGFVSRYRSIFFSTYALAFVLGFIPMLLEQRGHIALTGQDIARLDTPLCHLTIPMLLIPGLVYGVLIFPTRLFSNLGFFPMLFL
jgi:asparagine N-glycosylation enzyme membrane subunit Stt3